jgi:hypothetical protein
MAIPVPRILGARMFAPFAGLADIGGLAAFAIGSPALADTTGPEQTYIILYKQGASTDDRTPSAWPRSS